MNKLDLLMDSREPTHNADGPVTNLRNAFGGCASTLLVTLAHEKSFE